MRKSFFLPLLCLLLLGGCASSKPQKAERKRHKEELKLASSPEARAKVSLRTEPELLPDKDIKKMLAKYGFYDANFNPKGSFDNDFIDNGDGTIADQETGLMWERGGSSGAKSWKRARTYIKRLNKDQFAGHSDWRLPTIEEFASLVERIRTNGVHIDPIFDNKQKSCWSADTKLTNALNEGYTVRLQMVVDKSGRKLREGFQLPYTLFQVFMQSSKSNCVSCVTTRSLS